MRSLFILFTIALFLFSCKAKLVDKPPPTQKIFKKHQQMQLKNRMKLVATGVSQHEESIKGIALHYVCFKKMQVSQVRKTLIATVDSLLDLLNTDVEIQNLIDKAPMTYRDIKLNIGFSSNNGKFQEPPNIAWVCLDRGMIYYCYHDPIFQHFTEEENIQETYETALTALSEEQEAVIFKMQLDKFFKDICISSHITDFSL